MPWIQVTAGLSKVGLLLRGINGFLSMAGSRKITLNAVVVIVVALWRRTFFEYRGTSRPSLYGNTDIQLYPQGGSR